MITGICIIVALVIGILMGREWDKPQSYNGYNDPRLKQKPHIPPAPPRKSRCYSPIVDNLDRNNPPQGGSGFSPPPPPVPPPLRRMREGKREPVNQAEIDAWSLKHGAKA